MAPGPKRQAPTSKATKPKTKSTKPSKSKPTSAKSKGKRPSTTSTLSSTSTSLANSPSAANSTFPIPSHLSPSSEPDFILAEIIPEDDTPKIPPDLILRLLQHSFQDKPKTKINKEAAEVMGKYVEVFVREALARCAFSRGDRERDGGGLGDGFLEVEDLERVGGQIVLDF
jgi:hypothetical protein